MATQEKYAIAEHDCPADGEGELSLKIGDRILITEEGAPGDWWAGELNGVVGYFPIDFCRVEEEEAAPAAGASASGATAATASTPAEQPPTEADVKFKVRALHQYDAEDANELSIAADDVIGVVEEDEGW